MLHAYNTVSGTRITKYSRPLNIIFHLYDIKGWQITAPSTGLRFTLPCRLMIG
jgi:hypothetical protein